MPRRYPVFQLHVTLAYSQPPIWRRVLVPGNRTLDRVHDVLQALLGWENSHLHQFIAGDTYYSTPHPFADLPVTDERDVRLDALLGEVGDRIVYEYDFGDSWEHVIELEAVHAPALSLKHAVCFAGERAGPPDDSGGIPGYERLLEALADPNDPEHEELRAWCPPGFDPEALDLAEVNARLQRLR